jgi:hypothetical protein
MTSDVIVEGEGSWGDRDDKTTTKSVGLFQSILSMVKLLDNVVFEYNSFEWKNCRFHCFCLKIGTRAR